MARVRIKMDFIQYLQLKERVIDALYNLVEITKEYIPQFVDIDINLKQSIYDKEIDND